MKIGTKKQNTVGCGELCSHLIASHSTPYLLRVRHGLPNPNTEHDDGGDDDHADDSDDDDDDDDGDDEDDDDDGDYDGDDDDGDDVDES